MSHLTRRGFLHSAAAVSAGAAEPAAKTPERASKQAGPVIDCHAHLTHRSDPGWKEKDRLTIEAADKLGIDRLCFSILTTRRPATPEGFRECNAWAAEAVSRFPGRVLPYCYVNPGHQREALDEIRRCVVDRGFIGIKLYNEHLCTEPIVFAIVELAIELRVPILHHAGHSHYFVADQPRMSDGGHLAQLAGRYPEARLICAHVGGGGDWEWTIKAVRHARNVFLDTSGTVTDDGMIDLAVQTLGAARLLFGCDMSFTAGVGKLRAANLTPSQRRDILGGNMQKLLSMRRQGSV